MKAAILALSLALSVTGCASIRRHPIVTGVVVGLIAGSIALSVSHDGRAARPIPSPRRK